MFTMYHETAKVKRKEIENRANKFREQLRMDVLSLFLNSLMGYRLARLAVETCDIYTILQARSLKLSLSVWLASRLNNPAKPRKFPKHLKMKPGETPDETLQEGKEGLDGNPSGLMGDGRTIMEWLKLNRGVKRPTKPSSQGDGPLLVVRLQVHLHSDVALMLQYLIFPGGYASRKALQGAHRPRLGSSLSYFGASERETRRESASLLAFRLTQAPANRAGKEQAPKHLTFRQEKLTVLEGKESGFRQASHRYLDPG
ncbi:hypothetical protein CCUS01_02354 [Colletotrichum cuscutae]|uniref:Uncharacterized protein n=1 Tax=Colletotrichum cuscutae TaxID=1209917 RepID=A0AAI9TVS2_9PEZI|nr:hypothetical protein CCUS01_02354 [Colletotrichum cuscutae]